MFNYVIDSQPIKKLIMSHMRKKKNVNTVEIEFTFSLWLMYVPSVRHFQKNFSIDP